MWNKPSGSAQAGTEVKYTFTKTGFYQFKNTIRNVGYNSYNKQSYYGAMYAYLNLCNADGTIIDEVIPTQNCDRTYTSKTYFIESGQYLYGKVTSSGSNDAWGADDSSWVAEYSAFTYDN